MTQDFNLSTREAQALRSLERVSKKEKKNERKSNCNYKLRAFVKLRKVVSHMMDNRK